MKKKNGFTLVELLAVIVVLAIIMIIAIPAIMGTTNEAKKESFYLYAQSLQSKAIAKYTQDLDYDKDNLNCAVYDIKTDLGLSDTGNYDGWIKVDRVPVQGSKQVYKINVNSTNEIRYIKYCTTSDGSTCTPSTSYPFQEGAKSETVVQTLKKGSKLCVNYQYGTADKKLATSQTDCNATITDVNSTYKYNITLSLTSDDRAVENLVISGVDKDGKGENEEMSKKIFYEALDNYKKSHNGTKEIAELSCNGVADPNNNKGTTTTKGSTTVTTSSKDITTGVTATVGTQDSHSTTTVTTTTTTRRVIGVETTTTEGKGQEVVTTTVTTEKPVVEITTTTIDTKDTSLLLSTLNVSGHDIGFSPLKFYYDLTVPYETTSLNISASAAMPEVTSVVVDGGSNINVGTNVIVITLTNSETGATSRYRVTVTRMDEFGQNPGANTTTTKQAGGTPVEGKPDPTIEESDATLAYLRISGYPIIFSKDTYEYTVVVDDLDTLLLEYKPSSDFATTSIIGNENLKDGSKIEITVVSQNKYYQKKYVINVKFKNTASTSTKVIRGIAVGVGIILLGSIAIIANSKAKAKKMIKENMNKDTEHNVAEIIHVDNNNQNNNQ